MESKNKELQRVSEREAWAKDRAAKVAREARELRLVNETRALIIKATSEHELQEGVDFEGVSYD